MNKTTTSAVQVIAYAIEKDTNSLKELLNRNGITVNNNTSKDELQFIVTTALANSPTFQNEFKKWVMLRTNLTDYANSDGPLDGGVGYQFGQSGALVTTNSNTAQTFGGLSFSSPNSPASTPTNSTTTAPKTGFWSGVSLNSILDFAKDGMNNFVTLQQSKNDKAIVDSALEKERLVAQTKPLLTSNSSYNNTVLYVVLTVIGIGAIVGGVMYYNKTKK